jgi:ferric-dicitrate binding protein FerR (iron transport regulator)
MFRRLTFMRTTRTLLMAALAVVCLAPLHAQRLQQPVAKVLDLSGQVSLLDGASQSGTNGLLIPLSQGLVVKQAQVIVTGDDGWAKFQYTDGSTFEIFPRSKVVFQEHPADWEHLLNIWIGHVKVWIQHAPGVPNYKNVVTPTAVISVRGTVFSINVESEDETDVAVEEGIVDVRNTTALTGTIPRLTAGQSIRVIRNVPLAVKGIDKGGLLARGIRMAQEAVYQAVMNRKVGGIPGGGPAGNTGQGDKTKTGGTTPTPPSAPTTPPAPPPAPPAPPPGGGG